MSTKPQNSENKFMNQLIVSATKSLKAVDVPFHEIPQIFHEQIRMEAFKSYKSSLPEVKDQKMLLAEFYMNFENQMRDVLNDKYQLDLDTALKHNRFCLIDGFLSQQVFSSYEKTQEAQDLSMVLYNWKLLMNKLANVIYQVDFYGFDLNSKLKKKLFVKNKSKPKVKLSTLDWINVLTFKIMACMIESVQISSFKSILTNPYAQQITMFLLVNAAGYNKSSMFMKASSLTSILNITMIAGLVPLFNKFLKNPILGLISSKQMMIYTGAALIKMKPINHYLDQLINSVEICLENYNYWVLQHDEVKSNDELIKTARHLENFLVGKIFIANDIFKDEDIKGLTIEKYDNKWTLVTEGDD